MGIFDALFRRRAPTPTPARAVCCIASPRIGFLNYRGDAGAALLAADRAAFAPLFADGGASSDAVPPCHVLLVYGDVDEKGLICGPGVSINQLAQRAGARLTILLSDHCRRADVTPHAGDWRSNLVLVLDRREHRFAQFFGRLFRAMYDGQAMFSAWVALAPQFSGANGHAECPVTCLLPHAGDLTFRR